MSDRERVTDLEPDEEVFLQEFGPTLAALKARHQQCPSLASIVAAQAAALPDDAATQIAGHLAACDRCRAIGDDWTEFEFPELPRKTARRIRERVAAGVPPAAARRSRFVWRWAVPLGAAAGVIMTVLLIRDARQPGSQPAATAPPTPAAEPEARETLVAKAPSVLRLEKPPVRLPLSAAVTWRGAGDSDRARFAEEFKAAMAHYRADEYADSAARLAALTRRFPESPEVSFYLGVCQLFLGRNQEAIASLERARARATVALAGETSWYLALAHLRSGDGDRAESVLSGLCQGRNPYSAQACAGVQELKASRAQADKR